MRRVPIVATALVTLAVAAMIALGIWQLRRSAWKTALIATYEANRSKPPVAWPALLPKDDSQLVYRRATGFCLQPVAWREMIGHNAKGEPGWSHIASCRTGGGEGPGMEVDVGWSAQTGTPRWQGGAVAGTIVPDRKHRIRLVADRPAPGLQRSVPTSPQDVPNNHFAYAIQWFLFALTAVIIYAFALRRRRRDTAPSG
ncbi:MAG: SURF1 family protein [Alphaproteobacteria bacterium]|nr:SURF1 family protein [Alphaproteobacteria bacterium]